MVAFLSPKKSKVDIVQAIGRAMRKSGSKEVGYVLIPLYLEQKASESIEEAVARANFEEVWDILQSLQEQDEVLAELIRDMAVAKGSGKGFDDSRFSDRIAFTGPVLALDSIRQAVTTRVLERLESSWDVNFGKLVKFKEEHGHCRVPAKYKPDIQLGHWIYVQRQVYSKGKLSTDRITQLEALNFEWDLLAADWELNFSNLQFFKAINGHCRVLRNYNDIPQLALWVNRQRHGYSQGKISTDRIARLEALGFEWDPKAADWELNFSNLQSFRANNGHCRVPQAYKADPSLGKWVPRQRQLFIKGRLSAARIARLEALGFDWDVLAADWELYFLKLQSFKSQNGHCRVPTTRQDDIKFETWIGRQRRFYLAGRLPPDRIARLEAIGFEWRPHISDWERSFSKLQSFKTQNGHCRVPIPYESDIRFGSWVAVQRYTYRSGKLSPERFALLEDLGFEWNLC
jgi:hypothetical protein